MGLNIVETDNDEDNDDFEAEIDIQQVQTLKDEIKQQNHKDAMLTMTIQHLIQVLYNLKEE